MTGRGAENPRYVDGQRRRTKNMLGQSFVAENKA
jgi:hypothetical protein